MNARLKTYCIILTVAYAFILVFSIYDGSKDFLEGFQNGMNDHTSDHQYTTYPYIKLEPIESYDSFPEAMQNLTTNDSLECKIQTISAKIYNSNAIEIPAYLRIIEALILIPGLFILIGYIYIPFAFFSIVRKVTKGEFMNNEIIRKSYIIGSVLILSSFLEIAFASIQTAMVKHIVQFENYNIVYDFGFSTYSAFLLGLVIFIFAETLRISLKMKEEQDLTI